MFDQRKEWSSDSWWEERIGAALCTTDPVLCNLRITMAHYELSLAFREVLGPDTGANFHTWAAWGSRKAGMTIRQEDIPGLRTFAAIAGGILGIAGAGVIQRVRKSTALSPLLGFAIGGLGFYAFARKMLGISTQRILGGNITVLDDIGRATARYICTFSRHTEPDEARLAAFLATLRPGPTVAGGQDLLRDAFTHYYRAQHEADPNTRDEYMLLANLSAILHEHIRLEPYIDGSMPRPLRRLITSALLHYQVGPDQLDVEHDVPAWTAPGSPTTLTAIENPDLRIFLNGPGGWDRTPDSNVGSRARDWSDIHDRMNYICDLFRSRQFDPGLFTQPYTDEQCACLWAGSIPTGPL
ncbi:MAG: hypothetical protein ABI670_20135 [Chloroflexota bacterium]